MPKWVYPLSFVFLIFLIANGGENVGFQANDFAGFIGNILVSIGEFLTGMFEGSDGTSPSTGSGGGDTFGNTGTTTHTHGG